MFLFMHGKKSIKEKGKLDTSKKLTHCPKEIGNNHHTEGKASKTLLERSKKC